MLNFNTMLIATVMVVTTLLSAEAKASNGGYVGQLGVGLTSPLVVDLNGFGAGWSDGSGYYWGFDFAGGQLIIGIADEPLFDDLIDFDEPGWSMHLVKARSGGFWGVVGDLHIGVGGFFEWGGVIVPSGRKVQAFFAIGLEVPVIVTAIDNLWISLTPRIDYIANGKEEISTYRFALEAAAKFRVVGPLLVYGGVGFQHIGEGFLGSGTGPTYQIGLGVDMGWF
jgi:hypothetical protein